MHYFSTNNRADPVTFRDALLAGQAPDGGLYFPAAIPRFERETLAAFTERSNADIAFEVIRPYVGGAIADEELYRICAETVEMPFPLIDITERISALELFHGPTLAL